jgi:hypothetical protein
MISFLQEGSIVAFHIAVLNQTKLYTVMQKSNKEGEISVKVDDIQLVYQGAVRGSFEELQQPLLTATDEEANQGTS